MEQYNGNCHCGAYRFSAQLPKVDTAIACSCSLCRKLGALWVFPSEAELKFTHGDETALRAYTSNAITARFCGVCGTTVIGIHTAGPYAEKVGINARAWSGVNPFRLRVEECDISGVEVPSYIPPTFTGREPDFDDDTTALKLYTGSCHCGQVTLLLKSKPLLDVDIREDNCSICVRNAWIGVYPRKAQVTLLGSENAQDYLFGRKFTSQSFCKVCGVVVFQHLYGPSKSIVDSWSEARQAVYKRNMDMLPVNIRTLEGVEWPDLRIDRKDVGTDGYALD